MMVKRLNWSLLAILGLALVLRLISLADHSLWYDEAFAVLFAEKGLDAMLYGTLTPVEGGAADIHPLLYYSTLNVWMAIFGQSAFVVRLWSVLTGLASIVVVFQIGKELFNDRTGLAAALMTTLAPFHIHYSQETRMYSLLLLLLLTLTWCYLRAIRADKRLRWRWWLAFGILAGLAMYTQQLAAFYLVAIGLLPVFTRQRSHMLGMALGTGVALLVYFPWLINMPSQLQKVNSYYWIDVPGPEKFFISIYIFLTNFAEIEPPFAFIGFFGALVLILMTFIQMILYLRRPRRKSESDKTAVLLLAWLFATPLALMWLVSQIQPVYLERGLIASATVLYILIGWLLTRSELPRPLAYGLGLLIAVLVGIGLREQYRFNDFPYSPHHRMIETIADNWQAGDVIVHMNKLSALPAIYYGRDLAQHYLADLPGSPEDTLAIPTQESLQLLADPCVQQAAAGAQRVWFVTYERAEREYAASGRLELQRTFDWLDSHFTAGDTQQFSDLNLYLYGDAANNLSTECNI